MMTLYEIEQRAEKLRERLADLAKEIATVSDDSDRGIELLQEMHTLSQEAKYIDYNLEHFRDLAKRLITTPCSGPH